MLSILLRFELRFAHAARSCLLVLAASCLVTAGAGESPVLSDQIAQIAKQFEEGQERSFKSSGESLDIWRRGKHTAAVKNLVVLLANSSAADRPFCAYQMLLEVPGNRNARDTFPPGKAPIDEKGHRVEGIPIPTTTNLTLLTQICNLRYPPFSEVVNVVGHRSPHVQAYWQNLVFGYDDLRKKLLKFADQGETEGALQTLAYYWPECHEVKNYYAQIGKPIPRQRTWFTCVDRYLIDHELAMVDCLDTKLFQPLSGKGPTFDLSGSLLDGKSSWQFMERMRNCRIEAIITSKGASTVSLSDDQGTGGAMVIEGRKITLQSLDHGTATVVKDVQGTVDAATTPSLVQFEIRGRKATVLTAGTVLATADLPQDVAYNRVSIDATGMTAQVLRVRFLSEQPDDQDQEAVVTAHKAPPVPPVAEPWVAERAKQMDKPVTFRFEDTTVDEVVTFFSQLSGIKFTFDGSAEPLKTLPVTFSGKSMKLSSALDWLKRVSDISAQPTADGLLLVWKK